MSAWWLLLWPALIAAFVWLWHRFCVRAGIADEPLDECGNEPVANLTDRSPGLLGRRL